MDSSLSLDPRSSPARRWKIGLGIAGFLLAVSATIPCSETTEAPRYRRLLQIQGAKAVECRRLERLARAAGRREEAQQLARSGQNFARFAEAYRVRLAQNRLTWLTLLMERFNLGR